MSSHGPVKRKDGRPSVCLSMIVKDEEDVIERCLRSVRPFVDAWIVCDTGSSDRTREIVRSVLADLPGELHDHPWRDFAHNRNLALELSRQWADYSLVIDADEELIADPGFALPRLTADAYATRHQGERTDTFFMRTQFVRNALPWKYVGVLHEVLICDDAETQENLHGIVCLYHHDGARSQQTQEQKFSRDAAVLERALAEEPDNARHVFYLAQSYRDAGNADKAIANYRRRVAMGGWSEEIWYSLYQIGQLLLARGDEGEAIAALLEAFNERPGRAEPLVSLARHYRLKGQWQLAYLFAERAAGIDRPDDRLFIADDVYSWRARDEFSIAAYYVGRYDQSFTLATELLESERVPLDQRERVLRNREFAEKRILT